MHIKQRSAIRLYGNNGTVLSARSRRALFETSGQRAVNTGVDPAVGTGGARLYDFVRTAPNSQFRLSAHGVLRLTLNREDYSWAFLDVTGGIADSGADTCH